MADDWKAQKENIKRLYMDEDLTCKQLAVQMKELYGFERKYADSASEIYGALTDLTRPSVKEYQRHFSLWNFRKSLKQKEWRFVGRRIAKRKAEEGKESELIVNGYHFPQRKIRKALSRNFETTYENFQRQSVIRRSHTPDGIMITTPPRQRSPAACVYRRNLATIDGLPCLSFMHVMQQYVPLFEQLANSLFCAVQDPLEISLVLRGSGTSKFTQSSGLAALVTVSSSNSCLMETFKNVAPEHLNNFMAVVVELSNFRGKHMELEKMFGRTVMALTASVQLQNRRSQILDLMAEHDPVVESLVEVLFKNALHENQVSLVQLLLKHTRVGPNDSLGNDTPLDIAAESGSLAMTLTLLDAGAHLQHLKYGTKYWIKLLYKKFTRLEFQSFLHKYPLDEPSAIPAMLEIGDVELIDFFLERAIQKEFLPNSSVELALHWAIELKKMRLVDRIISSGFEFTPWGMFAAIYDNALHFVVMALERGMDANYVDGSGYSFLYTAISKDNIPIATVLLQFGANVDRPLPRTDHTYLLIKAVCEGLEDMVRLLLKKGADVHVRHSNGMSPLAYAILNGNYGIATYLVNWGAGLERPANQLIPTPLQIAAWNGDQHMVELLLERNADVNACPPNFEWRDIGRQTEPMNGRTALVNAIGGHSSEPLALVKLLISAGADVNEMQGTTSSALYTALQMREESVVRFLLNAGASPADFCAFSFATKTDNLDLVRRAISAGFDVNATGQHPETALESMFHDGIIRNPSDKQIDIITCLLDHGANAHNMKLSIEFRRSQPALCRRLIEHGARNTGAIYDSADRCLADLDDGFQRRDVSVVQESLKTIFILQFLPQPMSRRCFGHDFLFQAATKGDSDMLYALILGGVDASSVCGTAALVRACICKDLASVKLLVEAGAPVSIGVYWRGCRNLSYFAQKLFRLSPLDAAVAVGAEDVVRFLLQFPGACHDLSDDDRVEVEEVEAESFRDEDVSGQASSRKSTAYWALDGSPKTIPLLHEAGIDVYESTSEGLPKTTLQEAADRGDVEMVECLLQLQADVNALPYKYRGVTALQASAIKEDIEMACVLLGAGAHVNAAGAEFDGRTAIEGAAEWGRLDMVKLLLQHGADLTSWTFGDFQFRNAVRYARSRGFNAIARLIESHREL